MELVDHTMTHKLKAANHQEKILIKSTATTTDKISSTQQVTTQEEEQLGGGNSRNTVHPGLGITSTEAIFPCHQHTRGIIQPYHFEQNPHVIESIAEGRKSTN